MRLQSAATHSNGTTRQSSKYLENILFMFRQCPRSLPTNQFKTSGTSRDRVRSKRPCLSLSWSVPPTFPLSFRFPARRNALLKVLGRQHLTLLPPGAPFCNGGKIPRSSSKKLSCGRRIRSLRLSCSCISSATR